MFAAATIVLMARDGYSDNPGKPSEEPTPPMGYSERGPRPPGPPPVPAGPPPVPVDPPAAPYGPSDAPTRYANY
ncbi:MAG: hypothetical protein ACRDTN_09750, partial [Mycobacterium sp.]